MGHRRVPSRTIYAAEETIAGWLLRSRSPARAPRYGFAMKPVCRGREAVPRGARVTVIVPREPLRSVVWMGATLFLNPADDEGFVRRVNDLIAAGIGEPTELEGRLRAWYPNAVVRPRDLANERTNVWYVYRDGHWIPSD